MTGLKSKLKNIFKKISKTEVFIFLLAFFIGFAFHFFPYNKYLINEDTRQVIYWMRQFQDKELFNNDLLTAYAKNEHGWGFILLYYLLSFIADPMIMTKILAVFLYAAGSLYSYKLIKHLANNQAGFFVAIISMTTGVYTAALPRHFGLLFLLIFFYYFVCKNYLKSTLLIVLQILFYPIVGFVSLTAYFLSFLNIKNKKICIDKSIPKLKFFLIASLISLLILFIKYILIYNPSLGTSVTKAQILKDPYSYQEGAREIIWPLKGLTRTVINNLSFGQYYRLSYDKILPLGLKTISPKLVFIALMMLLLLLFWYLALPKELFFLFVASLILFKIAGLFLLKLYVPQRYIERVFPLINFVIFYVLISRIIDKLKKIKIKKIVYGFLSFIIMVDFVLNFKTIQKASFSDFSRLKNLYQFLNTLPKNTLIAGPPKLVDSVPTFSQRKVFLTYELSYAIYDNYWQTIKKRTYDFYKAYYSQNPQDLYKFLKENNIDYLVINQNDFNQEFLDKKAFYIHPFNQYITAITRNKNNFVLADIDEKDKLFSQNGIEVIPAAVFKP